MLEVEYFNLQSYSLSNLNKTMITIYIYTNFKVIDYYFINIYLINFKVIFLIMVNYYLKISWDYFSNMYKI